MLFGPRPRTGRSDTELTFHPGVPMDVRSLSRSRADERRSRRADPRSDRGFAAWATLAAVALLAACGGGDETTEDASSAAAEGDAVCAEIVAYDSTAVRETESGLGILDLSEGSGRAVEPGDTLRVHYTGCLTDGTRFDSSYDRGTPFGTGRPFVVGEGQVITGWDEGIPGMRPGGERILVIPSELAYGERGAGGGVIPPNATLVFRVELVGYGQSAVSDTTAGEG